MDNQEIQQKYVELQLLNQQIKQTQSQIEALQQQLVELTSIGQNLEDFKNLTTDTEALVQISNGIFAKAAIKDNKELIVNVGADIAVKKDVPSTKKLIESQLDEIKKLQQQRIKELQRIALRANLLEREITEAIERH